VIAFLFPGQGSQRPKLLADSAEAFEAHDLFASASDLLGHNVMDEDDDEALRRTEVVQRNVFLAGIAAARALERNGVAPRAAAGHSIGAFAAATIAGALPFADALELVELRGRSMARTFGPGYSMGAILGASERDVGAIVALPEITGRAYVAVINARDQIVIAGTEAAVGRALEIALARGSRSVRTLAVAVPSHTPLMLPVRDTLAAAIARVDVRRPRIPIAANVDGRALFEPGEVARDLVESVMHPVRWLDATQMLRERGIDCFIEAFLGDILTGLVESAFPEATALSLARTSLASAVLRASRTP
jgi:malonate decarboxylase epsilon subunit